MRRLTPDSLDLRLPRADGLHEEHEETKNTMMAVGPFSDN